MPSAQGYFTLSAAHIAAIRQIPKKQTIGSERVYLPPALHQQENIACRTSDARAQNASLASSGSYFQLY
jgi:hypothetical protein